MRLCASLKYKIPRVLCLCLQVNGGKCVVDISYLITLFLLLVGYDVYLVGGCVRDLILKQTPKDFDILTTADLKEVTFISYLYFVFESLVMLWQFSGQLEWIYKQLEGQQVFLYCHLVLHVDFKYSNSGFWLVRFNLRSPFNGTRLSQELNLNPRPYLRENELLVTQANRLWL